MSAGQGSRSHTGRWDPGFSDLGAAVATAQYRYFIRRSSRNFSRQFQPEISSYRKLIGTLLLWLLWPSFNAAVAGSPEAENLAIANTFVSLCGCILGFGFCTRLLSGGVFDTVHLQNATSQAGEEGVLDRAENSSGFQHFS